jgi:hypothetical protein
MNPNRSAYSLMPALTRAAHNSAINGMQWSRSLSAPHNTEVCGMNDETEKLRPEVRRIAGLFNDSLKTRSAFSDGWRTIRAELLRLADECATLKAQSIYPRAELLANFAAANERAEKADAELAALKARIAQAPIATLVYGQADMLSVLSAENADDWAGKTVRLLVVEE